MLAHCVKELTFYLVNQFGFEFGFKFGFKFGFEFRFEFGFDFKFEFRFSGSSLGFVKCL